MKITEILIIDINKDIQSKIEAKQGDTKTRFLKITLTSNSLPLDLTGNSIKIYGKKADGTTIFNNVNILDAAKGQIEVELTSQALAVVGDLQCEIAVFGADSSSKLTSRVFIISVLESLNNDSAIESTNEFTALTNGITKLNQWDSQFQSKYDGLNTQYAQQLTKNTNDINTTSNKIGILTNLNTTNKIDLVGAINENVSNLNNNPNRGLLKLLSLLQSGSVQKIKLIGDSVFEGVGSTGHVSPPPNTQPKIFDDGAGTVFYEGGYTERSFANLFREYIGANFPSVQFVNAGIAGKSAKWANTNKQYWISNNEDVIIVQLGTNDRWECVDTTEFKTNLEQFLAYVKARCNLMIVMTATPASSDYNTDGSINTTDYHFIMKDVDRVISDVCRNNGYTHISNYRDFLNFSNVSGVQLEYLLQSPGSHPIDVGYKVMWQNVQKHLGFIDNSNNFSGNIAPYKILDVTFDISTPPYDSRFKYNKIFYTCLISDTTSTPDNQAGYLTLFRGLYDSYIWEEFICRNNGRKYIRYWKYTSPTSGSWSAFIAENPSLEYMATLSYATLPTDSTILKKSNVTYSVDISGGDANISQYPEKLGGRFELCYGNSIAYVYETYRTRTSDSQPPRQYIRYWNSGSNVWSDWATIGIGFLDSANVTFSTGLTSFVVGTSRTLIKSSQSDLASFPEATPGVLITNRFLTDTGFSYQDYNIQNTAKTYRRWWTGSAWGTFSLM